MLEISSPQNPHVKQIVLLRKRRERDRSDQFIIEGYRELLRAAQAGWEVESVYICPPLFLGTNEEALIQQLSLQGARVTTFSERVFEKVTYRDRPDGLIAIAKQRHKKLVELAPAHDSLFVVAESIEKPGNLGTIIRSSDASGVDACIICDRCTDIYNPNVVRASIGTLFQVPVIEATGQQTLQWLQDHRITIVAATPHATSLFTEVDMTGPVAIAVGTEQLGLSERWLQAAHIQTKIPMLGVADSLNVATATTLLLYEALRQRKKHG